MHRSSSSLVLLSTLLVCVLQACQAAERGDSAALDFNSDRYRLQFELEETYNMVPGSGNGGWDAGPVLDRKNTILSFDDACTTYHHAVDVLGKMITAAAVPDSGSGAVGAARHVQSKKRETDNHKLYDRYRQYASWWLNLKNEKADSYVIGLREAQKAYQNRTQWCNKDFVNRKIDLYLGDKNFAIQGTKPCAKAMNFFGLAKVAVIRFFKGDKPAKAAAWCTIAFEKGRSYQARHNFPTYAIREAKDHLMVLGQKSLTSYWLALLASFETGHEPLNNLNAMGCSLVFHNLGVNQVPLKQEICLLIFAEAAAVPHQGYTFDQDGYGEKIEN